MSTSDSFSTHHAKTVGLSEEIILTNYKRGTLNNAEGIQFRYKHRTMLGVTLQHTYLWHGMGIWFVDPVMYIWEDDDELKHGVYGDECCSTEWAYTIAQRWIECAVAYSLLLCVHKLYGQIMCNYVCAYLDINVSVRQLYSISGGV